MGNVKNTVTRGRPRLPRPGPTHVVRQSGMPSDMLKERLYQAENWEYQASFTSDNTPWYFNGVRIQIFPSKYLKIEPWIINGWQSCGNFNSMPGVGANITWNPTSNFKILTNDYYGTDAAGLPQRKRFHSDNSLVVRYFNNPQSKGITKMAFTLTGDIGFEKGGGVNGFKDDPIKGPPQRTNKDWDFQRRSRGYFELFRSTVEMNNEKD